ncbi:hypothetical protein ABT075_37970 [Streptomyces sp. NPDC002677]|uniref:hypothetical protein n=1 Tax=Streptomyces sp. NPDC002677 TaxID=3154774 RepID=UPI0033233D6E
MPADEVTHGTDVDESRVRTGPRHAAPKKPLFTRFHMPAGKAIASVAMPTAVIMGMGFTSTLAIADTNNTSSSSKSLAEDYKDCVSALDSASPSASASASDKATDSATPSPTASDDAKDSSSSDKSSASDSGSDDTAKPTPSASKSSSSSDDSGSSSGSSGSDGTATPSPSASASSSSGGGLLDSIGDAITGILSGGSTTSSSSSDSTASATPSPSASASADSSSSDSASSSSKDSGSDTVSKTVKKVTDTVKDTTDTATKAADEVTKEATKAADDATASATASPSPSASSSTSADDCKVATDDVSGVDNKVAVADDPWYLSASSLLLKSADYQGVVEVKTAGGKTKKVLKYVISGGTEIGDLHQTVKDTNIGKTYHVQAAAGSKSTITGGDTTMYTESISGNLFGLIPITFTPDSPPPLNIPLIYFTNVKVVQAAQFGGTLHVPGMHVYTTDGTG